MSVKHVLKLTEEEREELSGIARGSRGRQVIAGWKVIRARALLKCDQGPWGPAWPDHRIAEALEVTECSLQSWRKRAVLEGPEAVLRRRMRVPRVPRMGPLWHVWNGGWSSTPNLTIRMRPSCVWMSNRISYFPKLGRPNR